MRHAFYFTADWCGPCKKVRPIVEEINMDTDIKFQFIDADDNMELCRSYEIKSIPTFILIEDGQEIKRMTGAKTKAELQEFIHE